MRMHLKILGLAVGLSLTTCFSAGAQQTAPDYSQFAPRLIEAYIRPQTQALTTTLGRLESATENLCAGEPEPATRQAFETAMSDSVAQLARVDFLRFGPLAEENRAQRLAFLPDRRRVIPRQLRKIMAEQDESVTTAASLAGKSVALQGLNTLEYFAFTSDGTLTLGSGEQRDFECAYAVALTRNLVATSQELEAAWADPDGFTSVITQPTPEHALVQTHKEAAELTFNAMVTGLVLIKDQILLPVIGTSVKKAKPYRAPFSRSRNGAAYMNASLSGIEEALTRGGFLAALPEEGNWVPGSLQFEFGNARKALDELPGPIRAIGKTEQGRDKLIYLALVIDGLKETMGGNLAGYLALSGGFNALDGD